MQVRLKRDWFGPTEAMDAGSGGPKGLSGHLFQRGVQEVPDEFRRFLPRDAEVLGEPKVAPAPVAQPEPVPVPAPEPEPVPEPSLKDFDFDRAAPEVQPAAEQVDAPPAPAAVAGGARKPRAGG